MEKLKIYREYCYDMDYNFYHNTGKELIPITRKEYKDKTGESDYIIDKLRNSRYAFQLNDYFFLKIEDSKYVPIDYLLFNLVKYFNNIGFKTNYVQQGRVFHIGFYYNDVVPFLIEKLGEENTIILHLKHDFRTEGNFTISKYWNEARYSGKFVIEERENTFHDGSKRKATGLYFDNFLLNLIYAKFGVKREKNSELKEKAHKGRRIIRPIHITAMTDLIRE